MYKHINTTKTLAKVAWTCMNLNQYSSCFNMHSPVQWHMTQETNNYICHCAALELHQVGGTVCFMFYLFLHSYIEKNGGKQTYCSTAGRSISETTPPYSALSTVGTPTIYNRPKPPSGGLRCTRGHALCWGDALHREGSSVLGEEGMGPMGVWALSGMFL